MPRRGQVLLLPMLAAIAGCARTPGTYDLPVATVFARLSAPGMIDFRDARRCGLLIHFKVVTEAGTLVRWVVTSSGAEVATFAARLTPIGDDRTKVAIEVPAAPDGGEIYDGTKTYARPALYQPLRPAVAELIDARVEQRPFDIGRIPAAVRAKDPVCGVQRAGLEAGNARFRYDADDRAGMGRPRADPAAAPIVPGQPMSNPGPTA